MAAEAGVTPMAFGCFGQTLAQSRCSRRKRGISAPARRDEATQGGNGSRRRYKLCGSTKRLGCSAMRGGGAEPVGFLQVQTQVVQLKISVDVFGVGAVAWSPFVPCLKDKIARQGSSRRAAGCIWGMSRALRSASIWLALGRVPGG